MARIGGILESFSETMRDENAENCTVLYRMYEISVGPAAGKESLQARVSTLIKVLFSTFIIY